jgi:uncharacterized protein YkwD
VKSSGLLVAAVCAASLLTACGDRADAPVQPPPLAHARAPEATVLGAGPSTGVAGAGLVIGACGERLAIDEVLQRINAARTAGYRCGRHSMAPAAPLKWDASLYSAAAVHSLDMARRNYFEHRSPEGADVANRAAAVHYAWKSVGENIAGGDRSVAEVMQTWLDSPGHCENILNPRFDDVAVACVAQPGSQWGTYWTMVLGHK